MLTEALTQLKTELAADAATSAAAAKLDGIIAESQKVLVSLSKANEEAKSHRETADKFRTELGEVKPKLDALQKLEAGYKTLETYKADAEPKLKLLGDLQPKLATLEHELGEERKVKEGLQKSHSELVPKSDLQKVQEQLAKWDEDTLRRYSAKAAAYREKLQKETTLQHLILKPEQKDGKDLYDINQVREKLAKIEEYESLGVLGGPERQISAVVMSAAQRGQKVEAPKSSRQMIADGVKERLDK